ncbi:MAG: hypothetical protein L6Q57_07570 [Alphaproteobacteria bacterium]|nr:hypothetical protein [Alphaproteobacteria bacterium]
MSKNGNDQKPVFDMYSLLSRWDLWLAVAFIVVILLLVLFFQGSSVTSA